MVVKVGGFDFVMNFVLCLVVDKVKLVNMFNDNIVCVIKKVSSVGEGEYYDEVIYEGYGLGGVVVLVYVLIDNCNWMVINVCVVFIWNGGFLGEMGLVNYMFDCKGYIVIKREDYVIEEDDMLEVVLEVGGEDLEILLEVFEIYIVLEDFIVVCDVLE